MLYKIICNVLYEIIYHVPNEIIYYRLFEGVM